jgi:hypothetical protein
MNSTNANGGVLSFRRNGTNVGHIGNSAQLGAGVLDALEVRSGIGSSVILKTDGGQLTLATGGGVTLTGALNGTSAVFSGNLEAGKTGGAVTSGDLLIDSTSLSANVYVGRLSSTSNDNTNFIVRNRIGSELFKVTGNTGAATFSSSVTAATGSSFVGTSENSRILVTASGVANTVLGFNNSGSTTTGVTNNTGYVGILQAYPLVFTTDSVERLRIASTGAATFSSSVMVNNSTVSNEGLSVQYNQAKTFATQTAVSRWHSNEASGSQFKLNLFAIGNATSSSRAFKFQTSNEGVANDGVISFQSDGGNVGIGTASPVSLLNVYGSTHLQLQNATTGITAADGTRITLSGNDLQIINRESADVILYTTDTERMRITSAGNVGINRTPNTTTGILQIKHTDANFYSGLAVYGTTADNFTSIGHTGTIGVISSSYNTSGSYTPLAFYTTDLERMRITSGGNVLIGVQTEDALGGITIRPTGTTMVFNNLNSAPTIMSFQYNGAVAGSITRTTSTTSYNIMSDYRLKEDLQELKGLEKVLALKVYNYKWKFEDSRMDGVLAHELAEILPYAVHGQKDAEQMQGVDYSKIVPILIKAIQELKTEIDSLKNQMQ